MRAILITAVLTAGAAFGGASLDTYLQAAPPAIEIPTADRVPEGTSFLVALRQPVGARVNGVGDGIAVDVVQPLAYGGEVVVPIGTTIHGRVTAVARPATRGNQVAVAIRFDELTYRGRLVPIHAEIVAVEVADESAGAGTATTHGHFSFGSAMSPDDAVSHTGIGGGRETGTVVALGTGEVEPLLNLGTRLTLRTTRPVILR
ncbi:MAG TPA: hypothetical protein VMN39_09760 [Longimicrobiaceae bacterium]|nr:hypothetical protein [Longimicrobiaceae bacterium]